MTQNSQKDPEGGAGFVRYEVQMMKHSATRWRASDAQGNKLDRRIYTEAFLLHVRNVLDFLRPPPNQRKGSDVLATDYISDWKAPPKLQVGGRGARDLRYQINKMLSHITYTRKAIMANLEPDRWPIDDIEKDLLELAEDFRRKLTDDDMRKWFDW